MRSLIGLVTFLLLFCFGCHALADGSCGEQITWQLREHTLTLNGTGHTSDFSSTADIPWYSVRSDIETVVVSKGITGLGSMVFDGCESLTEVFLPDTLQSIGAFCFSGCTGLQALQLPDSVTSLGRYAFQGCTALTVVQLPAQLQSIPAFAFSQCTALTAITLPTGITVIGSQAFESCSRLKNLSLPDTIESIGEKAFAYCSVLNSVSYGGSEEQRQHLSISDGNEPLLKATWQYGQSDQSGATILLPASLTVIESRAFRNSDAAAIVIPASVTTIEAYAFAGCSALRRLVFLGSPLTIADTILDGCTNVTIYADAGSSAFIWAADHGFTAEPQ